ncbi:hypothetical protein BU24DRAFT_277696 [Aaosphaeria arxii CBS 175.79]|uniref:Uncharacterized protein n=1 Tax=Aaosphaeria arxii CBS 175.79 TaxID=1450172 RepID=A0A6A5XEE2_9PLEO|nr:uncharacterized protein BU24DRAFT_277696 [Aaosphaeria arxii CBS 175.79]KAF2011270.1 hypothetical protein BU24DRAFT_277696 [Aaosphaeria arxii CBS 175.79]
MGLASKLAAQNAAPGGGYPPQGGQQQPGGYPGQPQYQAYPGGAPGAGAPVSVLFILTLLSFFLFLFLFVFIAIIVGLSRIDHCVLCALATLRHQSSAPATLRLGRHPIFWNTNPTISTPSASSSSSSSHPSPPQPLLFFLLRSTCKLLALSPP